MFLRASMGVLFIGQLLTVCTMLGLALKDMRSYRTPFGRNFLPFKTQIVVLVWRLFSRFCNVLCPYWM